MENFEWKSMMANEGKPERLDARTLRMKAELQARVMGLMCTPFNDEAENKKEIQKWIRNYAPSFDMVFKEVRARDPQFVDKLESSDFEKESAVEFFYDKLKSLEGPVPMDIGDNSDLDEEFDQRRAA